MAHQMFLATGRQSVPGSRKLFTLVPLSLAALLSFVPASAQTTVDLRTQTRNVDFSNASSTRVWKTGTTLPSQCNIGEGYFLSTAPAGQNLYLCSSANTWAETSTPIAGSGSEVQSVSGTFLPGAVPSVDVTGTEVSSGCIASAALMTCTGGINSGSGPSRITASEGVAPPAPATGQQTIYVDSADHNLKSVDGGATVRQYATLGGTETLSGKTLVNPSLGATSVTMTFQNETSTGTVANKLAKLTGSASVAITASVTDTVGATGVVISGAGTSGTVEIATAGRANCVFDGASVAGDYVTISNTIAGACHDAGTTYPAGLQILGRVLSTNGAAGTFGIQLFGSEVRGSSASAGTSFNPLDYTTAWWRDEMTTNYQWFVYANAGGSVLFGDPVFGDSSHPGILQLQTGSAINDAAYILLAWSNGAEVMQYPTGLAWEMVWVVKLSSLTTAGYSFGFSDSSQTNTLTLSYQPSLGADWFGISRNSGVNTTMDLGVPASTSSWAKLQLRSDGTIIYFSVNGSVEQTICASGCNATGVTGLISKEVQPYASVIALTAAQQNLGVDFFGLQIWGLSR